MANRRPAPLQAGLRGLCPNCGQGRLFKSTLGFHSTCAACHADFDSLEDTGDGPAVFVIFIIGILIVPLPVLLSLGAPQLTWLWLLIFIPLIIGLSVWLLRLLRGVMFAQGWSRRARETRFR